MKVPIVLAGNTGFAGGHLLHYFLQQEYPVLGLSRRALKYKHPRFRHFPVDLTKSEALDKIRIPPGAVFINASGYPSPEACETNPEESYLQNVTAAIHFARKSLDSGARQLIHLSTDLIFGEGGPHTETAAPQPVNMYGRHKLEAEKILNSISGVQVCLIRPVMLYGAGSPFRKNGFVQMVLKKLSGREPLQMVDDQYRNPTWIQDLAAFTKLAIDQALGGAYNLGGPDFVSPYELTMLIQNKAQYQDTDIRPVPSSFFGNAVPRALRTGVTADKARAAGWNPASLDSALHEILQEEKKYFGIPGI